MPFLVGSLWMEHTGTMEITSHSTGLKAVLSFKPGGWFSGTSDLHCVEGFIIDQNKQKLAFLYGRWTEFLCSADPSSLVALLGCKLEKINPDASNLPKHPPLLLGAVPGSSILWEVSDQSSNQASITFRPPLGLLTPRSTTTSAASPWSWMKLARGASWLLLTAEIDRTSGIFCWSAFYLLLLLNEGLLKRVTLTWQPRKRSIWKTNKGSSGWHIISSRLLRCIHAEFDNSSVGKSSRTKRRATGGRQDGLCLRNRQSLEKMTGGQLETFGRVIFRDLLRYFRPLRHGMGWPKILQEVKVLSPGIWGCERNMERIFIEIHSKSEIGSKVRVPKCCATNYPLYGDNQESFPCFSNNHTIANSKASYRTFILCFADVPKSKHNIWTLNHMTLIVHYFSHWWWTKQSKSMQLHNKLP